MCLASREARLLLALFTLGVPSAKLRALGFELRTIDPTGIGQGLPPSIFVPLVQYMLEVRAGKI